MSVSSLKPQELIKTSNEISDKGEAARASERMNDAVLSVSKGEQENTKSPNDIIKGLTSATENTRQDNEALKDVKNKKPKLELVKDNFKDVTKGGDGKGLNASSPDNPNKGR